MTIKIKNNIIAFVLKGVCFINIYNKEHAFDVNCDYSRFNCDYSIFWKSYKDTDMDEINKERIPYLQSQSIELNKYINRKIHNFNNKRRYTVETYSLDVYRIYLNRILMASHVYGVKNKAEALALLVLSIDPEFDAYIIFKTSNKKEEVNKRLKQKFGFIDENIIKIEQQLYNKMAVKEKHIIKLKIQEGEYK